MNDYVLYCLDELTKIGEAMEEGTGSELRKTRCARCSSAVSSRSSRCPRCGARLQQRAQKKEEAEAADEDEQSDAESREPEGAEALRVADDEGVKTASAYLKLVKKLPRKAQSGVGAAAVLAGLYGGTKARGMLEQPKYARAGNPVLRLRSSRVKANGVPSLFKLDAFLQGRRGKLKK